MAVDYFKAAGVEAVHVATLGLSAADDPVILDTARQHGMVVVTLDADFHALLALAGAAGPSVIRVRVEGLRAKELVDFLLPVIGQCESDIEAGAAVTVYEHRVGVGRLPFARRS